MQVKTIMLAASAAFALISQSASAGTLRVEAIAGWDRVAQGQSPYSLPTMYDQSASGTVYGGAVGYDQPIAPAVSIGVDAELDGASTKREDSFGNSFHARRDLYVGGRVTVSVLPTTRVYAKLGYSNARLSGYQAPFYLPGFGSGFTIPGAHIAYNVDGMRVGAGLQQDILPKVYLLAEYRYSKYKRSVSRNQVVAGVGIRF